MTQTDSFLRAERRLHDAVDRLEPAYIQLLQDLLRIPSPIGAEADLQRFIARTMTSLGLAPDVFDIDPAALVGVPGFNPTPREYSNRPCVVGVLKGTGGGRSLILNAHADTAPVENDQAWTRPPYGATIENGWLYGRGAWDDKAGIAECLLVVEAIRTSGVRLKGDLIVKIVVEDETTGNGSLACMARGYLADAAIIVDGTWPERYIVSHLGQVWFRIRMRGRPAHAAVPGNNPVDAIGPMVTALRSFVTGQNAARDTRWGDTDRPAFINFGRVDAGAWPGAIPNFCVIDGTYGFPPPETCDAARAGLHHVVTGLGRLPGWPLDQPPEIEFIGLSVPPLVGDAENDIARILSGTIERLHGTKLIEHVVAGYCDLRHYTDDRWKPRIPACLYGPGGGKFAHAEDEYFVLEHLPLVARNLATAALSWCGCE